MKVFFDNVERLVSETMFRSRERLSAFVFEGKGKYIVNAQNKGQDIGLSKAVRIAAALGKSLDELTRDQGKVTKPRDLIAEISAIHSQSGGRLEAFEHLQDYFDLYYPTLPSDHSVRPKRIGKYTLVARILRRRRIDNLRSAINSFRPELDAKLKASYQAALAGVPVFSFERFSETINVEPYQVDVRYIRLLLCVVDEKGQQYVLTYCFELPRD